MYIAYIIYTIKSSYIYYIIYSISCTYPNSVRWSECLDDIEGLVSSYCMCVKVGGILIVCVCMWGMYAWVYICACVGGYEYMYREVCIYEVYCTYEHTSILVQCTCWVYVCVDECLRKRTTYHTGICRPTTRTHTPPTDSHQ